MKCLNCAYVNSDDARFCQNCGRPLEQVCPNCGTRNSADAKFCKNCGHKLGAADGAVLPGTTVPSDTPVPQTGGGAAAPGTVAQGLNQPPDQHDGATWNGTPSGSSGRTTEPLPVLHARLAAAAPSSLREKARASAHLAGERRIVTALFADVVDSTALAETMDPEDWAAIMNRAFELLAPAIYHYEGTIARLMGDALLAFFGAPVAHEDDPLRAAQAGLDLIQVAREYANELRGRYGVNFAIRVGLNTGPVVVGDVGSSLVYEYTAMGDAVNLASRMQTAARPMTVLLSENTYRFLADAFTVTDLGPIPIKGKAEPVHVYELGKRKKENARVRGLSGRESPMVGRTEELEQLVRVGQAVQAGLGRAVLVTGEPGIGKSRLITEWQARLARLTGQMVRTVKGHCLSYGQGLAYHLLVDVLRSILAVHPGEEGDTGVVLSGLCVELFGDAAPTVYPYLAHLLSLPLEGDALERVRSLDPQALQGQYLTSLRRLLTALAARQPLVIILEDIHWADPSSIDLLIRLLPLVAETSILLCLLTRPDRDSQGWRLVNALHEQMGASLTEIPLRALNENESTQLVSNLLDEAQLPEAVRRLILSKTEGNPLFVEEVIHMLVERGLLTRQAGGWQLSGPVESVDIPDNLQSLLLARIDRLPDDVKRTLRVASVIGRQFPVKVLEEVLRRQNERVRG